MAPLFLKYYFYTDKFTDMKFLLLLCLFTTILPTYGQSIEVKKQQLSQTPDPKVKASVASDISWELRDINPRTSLYYARLALKYARLSNQRKIEAYSLSDIGNYYKRTEDYISAQNYYQKSLEIRIQLKNIEDISSGYNQLGLLFKQQEKYDSAFYYFKKGLNILPPKGYETLQLKLLDGLGLTIYHLGKNNEAIRYLDRSLLLAEKLKDSLIIAKCYQNKGIVNEYFGNSSLALSYYTKAGKIYDLLQNVNGAIDIQINKASIYLIQGRKELAHNLFLDAEQKSLKIGFKDNLSSIYLNLGNLETNNDKAYSYFKKAYHYSVLSEKANVTIESVLGMAWCSLAANNPEKIKSWLILLEELITKNPAYYSDYYKVKSSFFQLKGDYEQAFSINQKAAMIEDSLMKRQDNARQLLIDLELSSKERKILAEKLKLKTTEVTFQRYITLFLTIVVLILLALIYFIKRSNRIDREKKLQQQQFENEIKDIVHESELHFMEESLALEEEIRTKIGRDLHDHLGNKLAAAQITLETIEKQLINSQESQLKKLKNAIDLIDKACSDVRTISHDLVDSELTSNSLNHALQNICNTILPETGIKSSFSSTGETYPLSMKIKKNILATVSLLIDNILRHSKANYFSLQVFYFPDSLSLTLDDNGIGFNRSDSQDGIGIKNAENRIHQLGGTIDISSTKQTGTSTSILIPVYHD